MMLSSSGHRVTQTFKKLPKARPASAAKTVTNIRIIGSIEYTFVETHSRVPPLSAR
jgi:hypothetical protein